MSQTPTTTKCWTLSTKPTGPVNFSGDNATFNLETRPLPALNAGQLLLRTTYLSNDPIQRSWISPSIDPERFYKPPVMQIGSVIDAFGLAVVLETKSDDFQKGDWVFAETGWSEYTVLDEAKVRKVDELPGGLSRTHHLGALGLTGLAAWLGLTDNAAAGPEDIVLISGAAGATGSTAVQIAKHVLGCKKVIGIAGSEAKCRWVESLGADICLNYKSSRFAEDLRAATPAPEGFPTVFFDNVGGKILDMAMTRMARKGRIAAVGNVSNYNDQSEGLQNWIEVVAMELQIKGFNLVPYPPEKIGAALQSLPKAVEQGKLKIEGGEQIVQARFEDVSKVWSRLFEGGNTGKLITELI